MPHVVITGELDVREVFDRLTELQMRDGQTILRTGTRYLSGNGRSLIVEAAVIESGRSQNFLVLVGGRDDGLVVRIHPATDPEKTPGVKRIIAEVALSIIGAFPGAGIGKTNLQAQLGVSE